VPRVTNYFYQFQTSHIDFIVNCLGGPKDDGTRIEYPGKFVNLALEDGVNKVR